MDPALNSVLNLSPEMDASTRKEFNDGGFRMECFSSNNPDFLKTRPGYFICQNELGIEFVQNEVRTDYSLSLCNIGYVIFVSSFLVLIGIRSVEKVKFLFQSLKTKWENLAMKS